MKFKCTVPWKSPWDGATVVIEGSSSGFPFLRKIVSDSCSQFFSSKYKLLDINKFFLK